MLRTILTFVALPPLMLGILALVVFAWPEVLAPAAQVPFELGPLPFLLAIYVVMVFIAVPLFVVSTWRNWVSIWHALVIGTVSALLPVTASIWSLLTDDKLHLHFRLERLLESMPFVALGAIGGVVFWLLAVFRNPRFEPLGARTQAHARSAA